MQKKPKKKQILKCEELNNENDDKNPVSKSREKRVAQKHKLVQQDMKSCELSQEIVEIRRSRRRVINNIEHAQLVNTQDSNSKISNKPAAVGIDLKEKNNNKKSRNSEKHKSDLKEKHLPKDNKEDLKKYISNSNNDKKSSKVSKSVPKESMSATNINKTCNHEVSIAYNTISELNLKSRNNKRQFSDTSRSQSKRSKPSVEVSDHSISKSNRSSLRSTPARSMRTPQVLFTAFSETVVKEITSKLEKLGANIVTDVMTCTVLVTVSVKRTFKLLCAVGLGKPIVGPNWVQACHDSNMIVDPWLYVINDEVAEKRFHFSLEQTLAAKRKFLKGYNVSSTPSVLPSASEMKLIVECSGGSWKEGGSQWVCISSQADKPLWPNLRKRGAIIVSTEFILGGVLRQAIDIEGNKFQ